MRPRHSCLSRSSRPLEPAPRLTAGQRRHVGTLLLDHHPVGSLSPSSHFRDGDMGWESGPW